MKLTYSTNLSRWEAICPFQEKDIPKNAGFRWDMNAKRWHTSTPDIARQFEDVADDLAKSELEKVAGMIEASRSASTIQGAEIPCPQGKDYFPYQQAGIHFALQHSGVLIGDEMGLGKEQPTNTPILTPYHGWTTMGALKPGDFIYGLNGKPTRVNGVFPQGVKEVWRVTLKDGSFTECGADHLWTFRDSNAKRTSRLNGSGYRTMETHKMAKLKGAKQLPLQSEVGGMWQDVSIEPYVLGACIGDAYMGTSVHITIGDRDVEIMDEISKFETVKSSRRNSENCETFTLSDLIGKFRSLGLCEKARGKFIPGNYMLLSIQQRKRLLYGLMDTDGSCKNNRSTYSTFSEQLAKDVQKLVFSLGGSAKIWNYGEEYRVNVKTMFNPFFKSKFKRERWRVPAFAQQPKRAIESIVATGVFTGQVCISVDAPDNLYLTSEYLIPTHNTVQAIGVINAEKPKTVLVVCPATLKINWRKELERWLTDPYHIHVLQSTDQFPTLPEIVIMNYDILAKFQKQIRSVDWDVLIADEAHYMKNPKAKRTVALLGKGKEVAPLKAKRKILLTGTPITNRPIEIFPLISYLWPGVFNNLFHFAKRYCDAVQDGYGWDFTGASNLQELQNMLRANGMIRRLKADVLKELPPKTRQVVALPSESVGALLKKEGQLFKGQEKEVKRLQIAMKAAKAQKDDVAYRNAVQNLRQAYNVAFTEMAAVRKELAIAKIPFVIEYVEGMIEEGKKVVVMAHHREVIDKLQNHFELRAVKLYGGMSEVEKSNSVDRFQQDPSCMVFNGSIHAAGVGITLTAAQNMLFAELDWTPANMLQAEDRIHRIGQEGNALIQQLVFDESLDAKMADTLVRKMAVIEKALDKKNIEDMDEPIEIFEE
jgi:hypothetical protein